MPKDLKKVCKSRQILIQLLPPCRPLGVIIAIGITEGLRVFTKLAAYMISQFLLSMLATFQFQNLGKTLASKYQQYFGLTILTTKQLFQEIHSRQQI